MADSYYKKTPYGWCIDYDYENVYHTMTWKTYVSQVEFWLRERKINYSLVHYKTMVRVHVGFNAIKHMGYKTAVDFHAFLTRLEAPDRAKLGLQPLSADYDEITVRRYFKENDLPIEEETADGARCKNNA